MGERSQPEAIPRTDVLIIGGGPAGIQASRLIKTTSPETSVTVLRPEDHSIVYCALPYAMEGLFPLAERCKSDSLLTEVGAILVRRSAVGMDCDRKRVDLDDGTSILYEKLLIATGALPVRPPISGIDLANVFTVKTAADADADAIMTRIANVEAAFEATGKGRRHAPAPGTPGGSRSAR